MIKEASVLFLSGLLPWFASGASLRRNSRELAPLRVMKRFWVQPDWPLTQLASVRRKAVLVGQKGQVEELAFSPNGQMLAAGGSRDNAARLWSLPDARLIATLAGHDGRVARLSFSPDGETLESGSFEKTIRLWNIPSGRLKAAIEHEEFVFSVAFSPDSRTVATASLNDLSVMLWDAETGRSKAMLSHPKPYRYASNSVDAVLFSLDGKTLITSSNRTVYLWNVATAQIKSKLIDPEVIIYDGFKKLKGFSHGDTIYSMVISGDGRTLATGSRDGTAKLWDMSSGELRATLKGHKGRVHRLAFSPDGRTLATGSDDKTARLWGVVTGQLQATLKHRGTVWSLSFSSDSRIIATGSDNEHAVNLWDCATGELLARLNEARLPALFSPVGRTLATADEKNNVLLWDVPMK